jgi:hypothetical protein
MVKPCVHLNPPQPFPGASLCSNSLAAKKIVRLCARVAAASSLYHRRSMAVVEPPTGARRCVRFPELSEARFERTLRFDAFPSIEAQKARSAGPIISERLTRL